MSELNESTSPVAAQLSAQAAAPAVSTSAKNPAKPSLAEASDGSFLSHFLFFLGTSLFALPMLIPGMTMGELAIIYGGIFTAMTLFFIVWGVVGRLQDRRQKH